MTGTTCQNFNRIDRSTSKNIIISRFQDVRMKKMLLFALKPLIENRMMKYLKQFKLDFEHNTLGIKEYSLQMWLPDF